MRRLMVVEYVSLDGVVQAPGHAGEDRDGGFAQGGWTGAFMSDHRRYMVDAFTANDCVLLGRRTYEIFAEYWPTVTDPTDEIARALNTYPKYVASTSLQEPIWTGTTVLASDVPAAVATLKEEPGRGIIVVGSSMLTHTLIAHDLVDVYQLWMHPIVLGGGKRLFDADGTHLDLRLADARVTGDGLIIATYDR